MHPHKAHAKAGGGTVLTLLRTPLKFFNFLGGAGVRERESERERERAREGERGGQNKYELNKTRSRKTK
jgi:hypothetical protein